MPRKLISRPWTEREEAMLRALSEQGKPASVIAVRLILEEVEARSLAEKVTWD